MMAPGDNQGTSTRPYLLRALHDWCTDNGFTPYVAVHVDASVQVPQEYVKNNEIVLNIGFEATSGLKLGNEFIEFKARFGGMAREIVVPVDHVVAIYARENGQGMAFPMPTETPAPAAEPAAAPSRGLRLATSDAEAGGASGHTGTLAAAPPPGNPAGNAAGAPAARPPGAPAPDDDGPDPATPGGGRPALKRVK
jgi:stringent starvation protein B